MTRFLTTAGACLIAVLGSSASVAGVYTDDLTKCLVKSSDTQDQNALVQWMFVLLALNPQVKPFANVTSDQRQELDRRTAGIMQRLIFVDCRAQAVAALKYEGDTWVRESFTVLGQVAVRGLLNDPSVQDGLRAFSKYSDVDKWKELQKEAGVPSNDSSHQ